MQDLSEAAAVDAPLDAAAVLRHFVRVKVDVSAARAGQVHYSVGSSVWVGQPAWRELKTGDVVVRARPGCCSRLRLYPSTSPRLTHWRVLQGLLLDFDDRKYDFVPHLP